MTFEFDQRGDATGRKWAALMLTAVLAAVIAVLTLYPVSLPNVIASGPDKIYHLVAFTGLMLPASILSPRLLFWLVPLGLMFGGAIELLQPLVNRSNEWADFYADGAGIGLGVLMGTIPYLRIAPKSKTR